MTSRHKNIIHCAVKFQEDWLSGRVFRVDNLHDSIQVIH